MSVGPVIREANDDDDWWFSSSRLSFEKAVQALDLQAQQCFPRSAWTDDEDSDVDESDGGSSWGDEEDSVLRSFKSPTIRLPAAEFSGKEFALPQISITPPKSLSPPPLLPLPPTPSSHARSRSLPSLFLPTTTFIELEDLLIEYSPGKAAAAPFGTLGRRTSC